jgi:hypothetical protein
LNENCYNSQYYQEEIDIDSIQDEILAYSFVAEQTINDAQYSQIKIEIDSKTNEIVTYSDELECSEQRRPIAKLEFNQEAIKSKNQNSSPSDNNPSQEQK